MIKTSTKLRRAFKSLGIELTKKNTSLYKFELAHIYMLLSVDEELRRYAIVTPVIDNADSLNKLMFEAIIGSLEKTYENYSGYWNDGLPFVTSPHYSIADADEGSTDWLWEQLKNAINAFAFVEVWIYVLSNPEHLKAMGFPELAEELSEINKTNKRPAKIF